MPTRQYKPLRAFGHGLILGSAFLVDAAFSGGAIIDGFVAAFEKFSLSHESIFSTGPSATEVTRGWLRDGLYFVLLALVTSMGIHWMSRARSPLSQAGALRELGRNRKLAGVGMAASALLSLSIVVSTRLFGTARFRPGPLLVGLAILVIFRAVILPLLKSRK